MSMRSVLKQRGDTIVEVLIALSIISLVITVSYATAQRSLRLGQRAQERLEAVKVAESQIETLKGMGAFTDTRDIFAAGYVSTNSFCVSPSSATLFSQSTIAGNVSTLVSSPSGSGVNTYHDSCRFGVDRRYHVSITRRDTGSAPDIRSTFTVRVLWYRLGSDFANNLEEVNLAYNLHREQYGR